MATRKKTNKKPGKGGRIVLGIFSALMLGLALIAGLGVANASLIRIRRADVVLKDLPKAFDATTLLFASDIDLCGINTPSRSGTLFNQLQSLHPDILVLGGDYNSTSLLDRLNQPNQRDVNVSDIIAQRSDFFYYIRTFQAPLGKYAITSMEDPEWPNLRQIMKENGVQPLINEKVDLHINGARIWLAGICRNITSLNDAGNAFSKDDCVIAITEGPDVLPILLTSEAKDSGQWADLALCGHTHGGQIQLFGRSLLSLSNTEQRFLTGWNTQSGIPILTSEGVGCEGLNLRLGTAPEVWLITMYSA
jgi:predicted MPP superfamily phosphohydrolase